MKPLVSIQRAMIWVNMCSVTEQITEWEKRSRVISPPTIIISMVASIVASFDFFIKFIAIDLEEALYAVFQMSAIILTAYIVVTGFFLQNQINGVFELLTEIYSKYENEESFQFMEQANRTSEWVYRLCHFVALYIYSPCLIVFSAATVIFCFILKGEFDVKSAFKPFKMIYPWNQETLIGYAIEICVDIFFGESYLIVVALLLSFFISMSLNFQAFSKMFEVFCKKFEYNDKTINRKKILRELIDFHVSIKSCFFVSANVFAPFITTVLLNAIIYISCVIFQLDLHLKHINFHIWFLLLALSTSLLMLFFYCYFGKLANKSFERMPDCLYEANWYDFPIELQKKCILVIGNGQRSMFFRGFGVTSLDLGTFTKILKSIITYYTAFKTLTE